jgi:hypothetical protein
MSESEYEPSFLVKALSLFVNIIWVLGIIGACAQLLLAPLGLLRIAQFHINTMPFNFMKGFFYFGFGGLPSIMLASLISLLIWVIFLWIVWHLRKLILAIKEGRPFHPENPGRIRKIAYAVLLWAPVEILFYGIMFRGLAVNLRPISSFSGMPVRVFFELIFFGLAILVIAEVFQRGVQLQREQDLTV